MNHEMTNELIMLIFSLFAIVLRYLNLIFLQSVTTAKCYIGSR